MNKTIISLTLIFQCIVAFGQSRQLTDEDFNSSGAMRLIFATEVEEAQKLAQTDIEEGTPFLMLQSGIAPVVYTTDSIFENRFKVYYYEKSCTGSDYEMVKAYNHVIFEYLEENHAKKWRKSIRRDVIGLKKWKRKK